MANKRISELAAATTLTGAEQIPVVQGGVTLRTTAAGIIAGHIIGHSNAYVSSVQPVGIVGPYMWVEIDGEDFSFWIEDGI